ncbi:MAG TPA: EamA family transporter [Lacunisphaera sp.]|nr:EamA family transporter [Lacunisphaera sp.]
MTASERTPTRSALIAGFAAIYLIWGSTYLGIRVVVETIPPFLMAGVRFLVAGALIAGYLALTRGFRATARQWRDNAVIGGFLCLGGNGLVSWAEQKIPSGIATLIISVGPLFIVLLDWAAHALFRDNRRGTKPTPLTFVGLALGFAGLAVLVGPDIVNQGVDGLDGWSVVGLIGACLFWGIGMIYTKYAHDPVEPFTGAAIQMLAGSVWLLLTSLAWGEPGRLVVSAISGRSILAWSYLVVFGSLIGFTTFVWLMKHSTPARVSTYAYVNPIVAVFLGWWILREPISPRIFVASAIIIAGVAIITTQKNKKTLATPPRQAIAAADVHPDDEPAAAGTKA